MTDSTALNKDLDSPSTPYKSVEYNNIGGGYVNNDDVDVVVNEADMERGNLNPRALQSWQITDFNHPSIGLLSRDGSIHVTDEVFNSASHMIATMMSILGSAILISEASYLGEPWKIVSMSLYGASLIFLFGASTLHHSISASDEVEALLRMLDYVAIYPLIAGTFSPLTLVFYHDSVIGWCFFGTVWILSLAGMLFTIFFFHKIPKWMSMTMYISLGWLGAFMAYWLVPVLGYSGMMIFILGGVFYTAGGAVFTMEKPNPIPGRFGFHEIWHVAVILGAATHWCLVYFYVLP